MLVFLKMYVKTLIVVTIGIFVGVCEVDGTPFDYTSLLKEIDSFEKHNSIKSPKTGEEDVNDGQLPYQVALLDNNSNKFLCGGSVLNSRWILTAAHCVINEKYVLDESQIVVFAGSVNLKKNGYRQNVSDIVVNSNYYANIGGHKSDIALLKLTSSFPIVNGLIAAVTLPQKNYPDGTACLVSGWRKSEFTNYPTQLRALQTYTTSFENCLKVHSSDRIDSTNLCSKNVNRIGLCHRDSGGPLVVFENNIPVQIGVVSGELQKGCGIRSLDIYVEVRKFIDFINDNTKNM